MDIDFSFWLVLATLVTGIVVLLDRFWLRARRAEDAAEPVVIEYSRSFFPVLALVLVLRSFLAEPFTIPSGSMLPTLQVGDYIVVNKFSYGLRLPVLGTRVVDIGQPGRGDIMVFRYPQQPSTSYIKRVIGLPGDHIAYRFGTLYLNNVPVDQQMLERHVLTLGGAEVLYRETLAGESFVMRRIEGQEPFGPAWSVDVPAGHYFVMGDNRDNSVDSRRWGFVPDRLVIGKAFYIWMHKEPGLLNLPSFTRNGNIYKQSSLAAGE
ncbi:MAG: signal peptidase I [Gammaproteobacteria bacterium]